MVIEFADLNGIEKLLSVFFIVGIIVTLISAFMVFTNESDEIKGKPLLREIMGGLDVFVTSKYLNKTGKFWRIPFLVSITYIVLWVLYFFWIKA